ncbi:MAG: hypothetical protein LBL90_04100 [Prevotellaceae bacterium]|jgi:hypothetical protein|nr:hypothetical protein [Prevotellaceae bacterium]
MSIKATKKKVESKASSGMAKTTSTVKSSNGKRRLVVSYKNLSPELIELVREKYPRGYADDVFKVDKGNGDFFHAITLDTADATYLIKVDVKVDTEIEEVERQLFGGNNDPDSGGEMGDGFPDAEGDDFEAETSDDDDD